MTRNEYNKAKGYNYQPSDTVLNAAYDARCASCWLGFPHSWEKHDRDIALHEVWGKVKGPWVSPHSEEVKAKIREWLKAH